MMQKTTYITLLLAFILLLSACSPNDPSEDVDEREQDQTEVEETTEDEQEQDAEEPTNDSDEEAEEDAEEAEETVTEPIEARYEIDGLWQVVPIDDANPQVALLTFDDAPDKYALEMAHTLKEHDAPAIFFVNGMFLETDEQKEMLKEIHELGFSIGNHTYSHPNLADITNEEHYDEVVRVNDMVEEITGERPGFFRAPFGVNTDYTHELAEEEGMVLMNWTYGYDWESDYLTKDALADIMVNTEFLRDGANLLMHDREWTAAALGDIITGLRDKGYELVNPLEIKRPE